MLGLVPSICDSSADVSLRMQDGGWSGDHDVIANGEFMTYLAIPAPRTPGHG